MDPTPPPPLSVLVIDDDDDTVTTCVEMLALSGYEVRGTRDVDTALRWVATHPPDVVLLDIGLPKINGWELAARLRGGPKPPVLIVVSGHGLPSDLRRSAEAGIDLHLLKPVEPAVLLDVLERCRQALADGTPPALNPPA